jgi:hypothetical protein
MINLRSLRIRLARLEERFPQGDERTIADARLESLLWKQRINGLNSLTRAENGEKYVLWCWLRNMPDKTLPEVIERLKKHIAEFNIPIDLSVFEAVEPITKAEREDMKAPSPPPLAEQRKASDELAEQQRAKHYPEHAPRRPTIADNIKALGEVAKKHRVQQDERLRLRQLERQKEAAAAAARASFEDDAISCPDPVRAEESSRMRRRVKAEVPTARPRIINDEDDVDWGSIDYDD